MTKADRFSNGSQITRFPERLKEAIGNTSVRKFAQKCGHSESGLRKYLAGKTYPPLDKVIDIAKAADVSVEWLIGIYNDSFIEERPGEYRTSLNDEFTLIPRYRFEEAVENDTVNHAPSASCRCLAFRRNWLTWRGFSEKDLVIVWAKGDSMEPTINNNDTLVVNIARTRPIDGNLYVFRHGEELFIKRYQTLMGDWRLISDNKIYPPLDIPKQEQHQFEVVGQVVHIAKDIGD
ncbi:XRE family transcriptional regulator [Celerinatantimonas diazotrophica]|uniref:Phage repressor protein C with HTH and peptisase S24 domain n=1 Tax=Celerinatantimonas diazotrophica TaxID=412034 RepID=A0A4R1KII9_9GAMM|nr:LexA family transcriptional regulator [Celerinatantimonas diazotrophica]TCK63963.1 phage repressor protein C with HTH and peptisase S24 domain [Celerinatantimonas diazotrophica]CAG9297048.1 putative HTH-type transcriptional regulator [Celerinatantimonas diazotrophica]